MSRLHDLHSEAMDLAEDAFVALKQGRQAEARQLFEKSLGYEVEAANLLLEQTDAEPTRSILFHSAAALAYRSGDYEMAERLVAQGLAGAPPEEVKAQLRSLYEDIKLARRLSLQGVALDANEAHNMPGKASGESSRKVLTGILRQATSPKNRQRVKYGSVKLLNGMGSDLTIQVSVAILKDIVQPFFEEYVRVVVQERDGKLYLEDVSLADPKENFSNDHLA